MSHQRVKLEIPSNYDPSDNVQVDIPRALVPALGTLLTQWEWRAAWASDTDYQQGLQIAYLLQERLTGS